MLTLPRGSGNAPGKKSFMSRRVGETIKVKVGKGKKAKTKSETALESGFDVQPFSTKSNSTATKGSGDSLPPAAA
jgi:hypothetical protein